MAFIREDIVINFITNVKAFSNVMSQSLNSFRKNIVATQQMTNKGALLASRIRDLTHGMKGFRMEMLGVMFFGMMLQRTLVGLLRPALEVFGVFDLWRIMLQTLFLPIVSALFPMFLNLLDIFMNLSPSVKMVLGLFVLLGIIFSSILMVVGQFTLGLGALIVAGGAIVPIITLIGSVLVILLGVMTVIVGIIDIVKGKWEGLGLVIMGIGIILSLFIGWWALIPIAVGAAVFLIIKHWDKVSKFIEVSLEKIKSVMNAFWNWFKDTAIGKWLIKAFDFGKNLISKIIDGIKSMASKFIDAFSGLVSKSTGFVGGAVGRVKGFFGGGGGGTGVKQDFLMRPGQAPVSFSPNDTIVGTKGGLPGNGVNITQNITVTGTLKEELENMIQDNNSRLVDEVKRLTTA